MANLKELNIIGTYQTKEGTLKGFLDAVTIWINKPHVVNKRLCGAQIVQITSLETIDSVDKVVRDLKDSVATSENDIENHHDSSENFEVDLKENDSKFVVISRKILPKNVKGGNLPMLEAVIFESATNTISFHPLYYVEQEVSPKHQDASTLLSYGFSYVCNTDSESEVRLVCSRGLDDAVIPSFHPSPLWLCQTLAAKVTQWTQMTDLSTSVRSLRLVSLDRYNALYCSLKDKYGQELVQNWTEATDPQKFVYEDIGIAAYLLLIWEEDRRLTGKEEKQTFVDLGCGNGLLVYILSKEGHRGLGIDLRKRKIWEQFGTDVSLEERSITPSADSLFPAFDWLIGNHSDELTPWIPVMAARSSFQCCYFVLPCCLHDFDRRFNTKIKGESSYHSYLAYVGQVGAACGFKVEEDTLRIPSTKRVCHIGRRRTYPAEEEEAQDRLRRQFIDDRCQGRQASKVLPPGNGEPGQKRALVEQASKGGNSQGKEWAGAFQARSSTELVRNCQKIGQATKQRVVKLVFTAILEAPDAVTVDTEDGRTWRKGGSVPLGDVAAMLDTATKQELKSECGGVQTLLRNHHNIFQVSGGKVQLRDFSIQNPWSQHKAKAKAKKAKMDSAAVHKTTLCWFHDNHPDGCPRPALVCTFAHGQTELRPKPEINKK